MKRLLLFAVFAITALTASLAQVGIGTETPHGSAQLDVVASDKGVLLPRVALESTTDSTTMVAGNENSILVFNTVTQNDIIPGFYYWYVDRWYKIANTSDETITTIVANPDGSYSYFNHIIPRGSASGVA